MRAASDVYKYIEVYIIYFNICYTYLYMDIHVYCILYVYIVYTYLICTIFRPLSLESVISRCSGRQSRALESLFVCVQKQPKTRVIDVDIDG